MLCNKESMSMRYDIKNVDIEEVSFINRTIISLNVGTEWFIRNRRIRKIAYYTA